VPPAAGRLAEPSIVLAQTAVSIRHAAFVAVGAETVAVAKDFDALGQALEHRQIKATTFAVTVKKLPGAPPVPSPVAKREIGMRIEGRADLRNPAEEFLLVATPQALYLGRVLSRSDNAWRQHERRPHTYIRALPARLARAMVNLVAKPGQQVLDPCCGVGTIPIEAEHIGCRVTGFDLSPKMADASNQNLQHFGFPPCAAVADARTLAGRWDAVVTDLPYGHIGHYEDAKSAAEILPNILTLAPRAAIVLAADATADLTRLGHPPRQVVPVPASHALTRHIHVIGPG